MLKKQREEMLFFFLHLFALTRELGIDYLLLFINGDWLKSEKRKQVKWGICQIGTIIQMRMHNKLSRFWNCVLGQV